MHKGKQLHACVVVKANSSWVRSLIWLITISDGSAFVHDGVVGRFCRGLGRAAVDYWSGLKRPDGQSALHVLVGVTPEYHAAALRGFRIMGFTSLITIPNYCRGAKGLGRCGAVISHEDCETHRQRLPAEG